MHVSADERLCPDERAFFAIHADIIFSNPFRTERTRVERPLGPVHDGRFRQNEHHYAPVLPLLDERMTGLVSRGIDRIQSVAADDRLLSREPPLPLIKINDCVPLQRSSRYSTRPYVP